jgi:hypothetical protein
METRPSERGFQALELTSGYNPCRCGGRQRGAQPIYGWEAESFAGIEPCQTLPNRRAAIPSRRGGRSAGLPGAGAVYGCSDCGEAGLRGDKISACSLKHPPSPAVHPQPLSVFP